jgi:hypothetical protein
MIGAVIAVVATIVKAALTGIGLATGFAIIGGIPGTVYRVSAAKEEGRSLWRAMLPPWVFTYNAVGTPTEEPDEQQFSAAVQPT